MHFASSRWEAVVNSINHDADLQKSTLKIRFILYLELRFLHRDGDLFFYEYNGKTVKLSEALHNQFFQDPVRVEQNVRSQLESKIQGVRTRDRSGNGDENGANQNFRNRQDPTRDELSDSQNFNSFKPNRQSSSGNIYFPQPVGQRPNQNQFSPLNSGQSQSDFLPPPNTLFNIPIPESRDREEFRGSGPVIEFAWNLFKSSNSQPNFVMSPLSPQMLLSYLAWVADGQTRNELVGANGYGSPTQMNRIVTSMLDDKKGRELEIATAFFVSKDMRFDDVLTKLEIPIS